MLHHQSFNVGAAIRYRIENAVKSSGTSIKEIKADVVDQAFDRIQKEVQARNITSELEFFSMMKELGGYTAIIRNVIGDRPESIRNEIQMETNPAYYIWLVKDELIGSIRESVQIRCASLEIF